MTQPLLFGTYVRSIRQRPPINWRLLFVPVKRIAIGILGILLMSCRDDPESPGAKRENSVLEAVATKFSAAPAKSLEFVDFENYHFVLLQSQEGAIWIMLDPHYTPFYKQLPWNRAFVLTPLQFEEIDKKGAATLTVIHCLASHVQDRPN